MSNVRYDPPGKYACPRHPESSLQTFVASRVACWCGRLMKATKGKVKVA